MQGSSDDERQDPKEAGKAWNFREFIHGTEIAKAARLDSAADRLLLAILRDVSLEFVIIHNHNRVC